MTKLIITLKRASDCWLAKFSDEVIPDEYLPTAYTKKAPVDVVIAGLLKCNPGAEFIVE